MKTGTTIILALVSFMVGSTALGQSVLNCSLKSQRVEKDIKAVTRQLQGQEYCLFRRYDSIDDIDGDGKEDFAAISEAVAITGGRRRKKRSVDAIARVDKNQIITSVSIWKEGDPLCCPSSQGESIFGIKNGEIKKAQEKSRLTN